MVGSIVAIKRVVGHMIVSEANLMNQENLPDSNS